MKRKKCEVIIYEMYVFEALFHKRNVNVNSIFIHSFGITKFLSVCLMDG